MPFVSRSTDGAINGLFEQLQEGRAEQFLAADDGEVVAFENAPAIVLAVSSRQFKLQLLAMGSLDAVTAWVAGQSRAVQIAYEYSGTFVKSSPMMQDGFTAMGFTSQQLDAFFEAAAQL